MVSIHPPKITPVHAAVDMNADHTVSLSPDTRSDSTALEVVDPDSVCSVLPTTFSNVKTWRRVGFIAMRKLPTQFHAGPINKNGLLQAGQLRATRAKGEFAAFPHRP